MGLLDMFFGSYGPRKKPISFDDKSKLSRQDIIDLVWNIQSLDTKQKQIVREWLEKELDDSGVTEWEYKNTIRRLSEHRRELGLSEVDIKNLRKII